MRPWNLGPHFERYNLRNVSLDSLQPTCEEAGQAPASRALRCLHPGMLLV